MIEYNFFNTKYGKVLVAFEDEILVAFLFLAEYREDSLKLFHKKFPDAVLCKNKFSKNVNKILASERLEYKFYGTPFQIAVWQELAKVTDVISYKDFAMQIGKENSVRAVANAIAKNMLHFVLPCHLLIRSSGDFGDFAAGRQLKEKLIQEFRNQNSL